jgi:hypothetical protein
MLGLLLQQGSLDMMTENSPWIVGMLLIAGFIYYVAQKGLVTSLNRAFNPGYFRATKYLKEQVQRFNLFKVKHRCLSSGNNYSIKIFFCKI